MNRLKLLLSFLVVATLPFNQSIKGMESATQPPLETSRFLAAIKLSYLVVAAIVPSVLGYDLFKKMNSQIKKQYYKELYTLDQLEIKVTTGDSHNFKKIDLDNFSDPTKSTLISLLDKYEIAKENVDREWQSNRPKKWGTHRLSDSAQLKNLQSMRDTDENNLLSQINKTRATLPNPSWLQWLPTAGAIVGGAATALIAYTLYKNSSVGSFSEFIEELGKPRK